MMGPLISAKQRRRSRATPIGPAEGAAVIGDSEHLDGFFYEPMLAGADENSVVAQDELFGPVLVVLAHDGDDDAVRIANSIFGLLARWWVAIVSARVARRIRAGTMSVNGGLYYAPDAFGGYNNRDRSRDGTAGLQSSRSTSAGRAALSGAPPPPSSGRPATSVRALREVIRHPDLDLVGVLAYDLAKAGRRRGRALWKRPLRSCHHRSGCDARSRCGLCAHAASSTSTTSWPCWNRGPTSTTRGELVAGGQRLSDDAARVRRGAR
jgi:hypothetical protein